MEITRSNLSRITLDYVFIENQSIVALLQGSICYGSTHTTLYSIILFEQFLGYDCITRLYVKADIAYELVLGYSMRFGVPNLCLLTVLQGRISTVIVYSLSKIYTFLLIYKVAYAICY